MSFLKITDPEKRDSIVNEFLNIKREIRNNSLSDKLGESNMMRELAKLYKPITDLQEGISTQLSSIRDATADTSLALKALPTIVNYPQIKDSEDTKGIEEAINRQDIGEIAKKKLGLALNKKSEYDYTFGVKSRNGRLYMGNTDISVKENNITIGDKTYEGTEGLWELLTLDKPQNFDQQDMESYKEILLDTKAVLNPETGKVLSNRGEKYQKIIKPIYDEFLKKPKKTAKGKGITLMPSDPNILIEWLTRRLGSYRAGNTGVRNEIIDISDELVRQGIIDEDLYKKLMLQL